LREINQIDAMERRLERTSMPQIRRELNTIAKDAISALRIGGQRNAEIVIEGAEFKLSETIEKMYKRTIKNTEKVLLENYPKDPEKVKQVRRELERNFKKQAQRAAKQISDSTKRQMDKIIRKGLDDKISDAEIQKKLQKKIGSNARRAQVISEVEIGSVTAEGRDKLSKKVFDKDTRKVWVTHRDSKVRDSHQYAEGQTVQANENFVLRGRRTERPPYPRWRGLSAGERVNCRCKVIFLKDGE